MLTLRVIWFADIVVKRLENKKIIAEDLHSITIHKKLYPESYKTFGAILLFISKLTTYSSSNTHSSRPVSMAFSFGAQKYTAVPLQQTTPSAL